MTGRTQAVRESRSAAALQLAEGVAGLSQSLELPDDVYETALAVFSPDQDRVLVWIVTVYNAFNRLSVSSRTPLPTAPMVI